MKNEVPANNTGADENKVSTDERLTERLHSDMAVDLEKPENQVADPIPSKINGVDAPWAMSPKRSKKPVIVIILAILLLLAATAAWYFLIHLPSQTKEDSKDGLAAATQFESATTLVNQVSPSLKGAVVDVREATGVSAVDDDGNYAYGAPIYKPSGALFGSLPLTVVGSGHLGNSVIANENYESLKDFFEENKFVKRFSAANEPGFVSDTDAPVTYNAYAEYESGTILCTIYNADATATSMKSHIASIGCAEKESYKQAAEALKPIHDAYLKGESGVSSNLVFGFLREEQGANGYKYVTIYQEDDKASFVGRDDDPESLTGLYYQAPGASEWTYFMITPVDSQPSCASYNSEVLKTAFRGHECFDEATRKDSTVK